MTRPSCTVAACAALILLGSAPIAHAGGPYRRAAAPVVSGYRLAPPAPVATGVAVPVPVASRPRYLGTFRPDPTLVMRNGSNTGGSYTPGGLPRSYATMSLYGPFSRLRSLPNEVVTYSRGYDGVLRPTSSGIVYEYPDPRRYPDTTLVPTGDRYNLSTGKRVRSAFGRYLLGQD